VTVQGISKCEQNGVFFCSRGDARPCYPISRRASSSDAQQNAFNNLKIRRTCRLLVLWTDSSHQCIPPHASIPKEVLSFPGPRHLNASVIQKETRKDTRRFSMLTLHCSNHLSHLPLLCTQANSMRDIHYTEK
jgi:hypothetical protein